MKFAHDFRFVVVESAYEEIIRSCDKKWPKLSLHRKIYPSLLIFFISVVYNRRCFEDPQFEQDFKIYLRDNCSGLLLSPPPIIILNSRKHPEMKGFSPFVWGWSQTMTCI